MPMRTQRVMNKVSALPSFHYLVLKFVDKTVMALTPYTKM